MLRIDDQKPPRAIAVQIRCLMVLLALGVYKGRRKSPEARRSANELCHKVKHALVARFGHSPTWEEFAERFINEYAELCTEFTRQEQQLKEAGLWRSK